VRKIQTVDVIAFGIDVSKNKADIWLKTHPELLLRFAVIHDKNGISMLLNRLYPH
jgi:hypothetical protein